MNTNDIRSQKVYEALETLPLSQEELERAEAYVLGEEEEEGGNKSEDVLAQFSFRDLSGVPSDKLARLLRDFSKRGRTEELTRLFDLLFTIGQSTISQLLPLDMITWNKSGLRCESWKKAALYAPYMDRSQYHLIGSSFNKLLELADGKPETLLLAAQVQREKKEDSKLILLAAYFLCKYPNRDALEEDGAFWKGGAERQSGGLFAAVGKLFGRKRNGKVMGPDEEDAAVLKQYEDLLLSMLSDFFRNQIHMPNAIKILEDIKHDHVTEETLQMAGKNIRMSEQSLRLLGGTAYLNFPLSVCLKNVVKIFMAANMAATLQSIATVSLGTSMDLLIRGGNFDMIFDLPPVDYIDWIARKNYHKLMKIQLHRNEESYLKVIDQIDIQPASEMLGIIKEERPDLYDRIRKERQNSRNNKQKEKVIAAMVGDVKQHINEVKAYLREEEEIETLYPFVDALAGTYSYSGYQQWNVLSAYEKNYMDEVFVRRCSVLMLFQKAASFFTNQMRENYYELKKESVRRVFRDLEAERVTTGWQMTALALIHDAFYSESQKEQVLQEAAEVFEGYLETRREETLMAFSQAEAVGRNFALKVLGKHPEENKQEILRYSTDTSKAVKESLLHILYGQKDWEEEVKAFLSSKKAGERELAVRTLLYWQGEEKTYQDLFTAALEKEKNAKMRLLLQEVLQITVEGAEDGKKKPVTKLDLVKELHKGGRKRSLAWAYEGTPFCEVHKKDGELASEEYLQAILICYSSVDGCGVSKNATLLAEELKPEELAVYVNELFDKWMAAGAEAKKRWVLYAAAIHGGSEIIQKLQHQLTEWPQNSRGAIAAEAVQALSLNPLPQALLIVDGISRKFKFKQVKAAAAKALEFAASELGITTEELADRIVPDMGFDENVERKFDYGARSFTVTMTPALEIEVYDESGKKLKNLPSPGKKDDEEKAKAAYEEFKQMKKQMKLTVSSQKQRLEMALSTGREWSVEAWKALFVKNPVMHQFAIGLIWGTYNEKHELVQSFRYMEDGSFNTEDEEEYELPEAEAGEAAGAEEASGEKASQKTAYKIGLVHPTELSAESRETWKEQLSDYEIVQPFEQLERTIYLLSEEEEKLQRLERFGGCIVNDLSLNGKLLGMGWYRGSVVDGGGFYVYYREDAEIGLGVELYFSGTYVSPFGEDVTIYDARFYKPGAVERGSYVYDEVDKKRAIFLRDVPSRYFSEIVWQLTKATASSQERDETWSNDWPKEK